MKCEGTREEWRAFTNDLIINLIGVDLSTKNCAERIYKSIESRGWITKPEWEQAYYDYWEQRKKDWEQRKKDSNSLSYMYYHSDTAIETMRDRIIELEKERMK